MFFICVAFLKISLASFGFWFGTLETCFLCSLAHVKVSILSFTPRRFVFRRNKKGCRFVEEIMNLSKIMYVHKESETRGKFNFACRRSVLQ